MKPSSPFDVSHVPTIVPGKAVRAHYIAEIVDPVGESLNRVRHMDFGVVTALPSKSESMVGGVDVCTHHYVAVIDAVRYRALGVRKVDRGISKVCAAATSGNAMHKHGAMIRLSNTRIVEFMRTTLWTRGVPARPGIRADKKSRWRMDAAAGFVGCSG